MPDPVWLVARLSTEEGAWLPRMFWDQVAKEMRAAEEQHAARGTAFPESEQVVWLSDTTDHTVVLRCGYRERLLKLAEWLLVVSDTADMLIMRSATQPTLPSAQSTPG